MNLPDDIHIVTLEFDESIDRSWLRFLSDEEINRRASMRNEERRRHFVLGRIAARTLIGRLTGVAPSQVHLRVEPAGWVSAPDTPYNLSIAHSGNQALVAASRRRVGVDTERIVEKPESLLRYILHEEEVTRMESLSIPPGTKLFLYWAIKEAVLKALGTGLRQSPKLVRPRIDLAASTAYVPEAGGSAWDIVFSLKEDFVSAVAFDPRE